MNDTIENCVVKGNINIDNANVNSPEIDVVQLRTKIGMVFQKPNPFPKSIFDNVAYGPKIHGMAKNKLELAQESEMPRAYEVAGQLIKSVSDATDKLMDLQKKLKDVNEEEKSKGPSTVNNALFVGSTSELSKILKSGLNKENK